MVDPEIQELAIDRFFEELDKTAEQISSACSMLENLDKLGGYPFQDYPGYRQWLQKLTSEFNFMYTHIKGER